LADRRLRFIQRQNPREFLQAKSPSRAPARHGWSKAVETEPPCDLQPMKLTTACADFTFPLLPHAQVLDLIAMLEFDGVDIGLFEGRSHLWPSKALAAPSRAGKVAASVIRTRPALCRCFSADAPSFVPYAINHPQAARRRRARDWFLKTLEYATAGGARHVTTLPGVLFEDEPRPIPGNVVATNWRGASSRPSSAHHLLASRHTSGPLRPGRRTPSGWCRACPASP
jgi:hypothetical protein